MKKMAKVMVLVMAVVFMVPTFAHAVWVTANVLSVGVGGTFTYIQLNDTADPPAFPGGTYYSAEPTRAKDMLATALTAVSLSKTVLAWLDDVAPYSNMSCMYLNQ